MRDPDPLGVRDVLTYDSTPVSIVRAERLTGVDAARWARRPRIVRILLENMLRHFDPAQGEIAHLRALANGEPTPPEAEFAYFPERVLLQDFTGIPVLVDLSTLRNAAADRGLPADRIDPVVPVDLIVDHSVQVDSYGSPRSLTINLDREYERNGERYRFLRWAKGAYRNIRIVPPGNGICHQVNLEHLATVVSETDGPAGRVAFPDTVIGTDSHTTMVNGLSVLGWGVGGIEAEAVLLGEPYFLARPFVVGVELTGRLPSGATATDLVLTITRKLREKGVVDRFVEFYGPGVASLSVPDRATVSNMCPEYGATAALFPIDEGTIAYLRSSGRDIRTVARVDAYSRALGLWGSPAAGAVDYDDRLELDLGTIVPTVSGPRNPEESVPLDGVANAFRGALKSYRDAHPVRSGSSPAPPVSDGSVVIAAITSCTNTSNPSVMVGAGLIARKARALGLRVPSHVKTSLAPGSKVVTAYLDRAGLRPDLDALGFQVVGYGCTTCIGNSGPLPAPVAKAIEANDLYVAAVLSGNRNFEARVHNQVRANYLASPMLVVAYALAGRIDIDLTREPLGHRSDGAPVFLRELWPDPQEVASIVSSSLGPDLFRERYRAVEVGDEHWESLPVPKGMRYPWDPASTYLAEAPYLRLPPPWLPRHGLLAEGVRALAVLGDRVSTDHISPAGEIPAATPAGRYLADHGVPASEFNTYGARRGHHEVLLRGTFANVRLKNALAAPQEGGVTVHLPTGTPMTIFEAAERYRRDQVPLIVLAGKGYGQGSSRDWAAKGPRLLGVGAVLAESFERIHRTNLIEMGVLPLQYRKGETAASLGWTGRETFAFRIAGAGELVPNAPVEVAPGGGGGPSARPATVTARLNSAVEVDYYRSGGVLPYVMDHRFTQ